MLCGGWCPKGRLAEDGRIPDHYPLEEIQTTSYNDRTIRNIQDSDGSLIVTGGSLDTGTQFTLETCKKLQKPFFSIDLTTEIPKSDFIEWLDTNQIKVLNIAGPRESHSNGIYNEAYRLMVNLLE